MNHDYHAHSTYSDGRFLWSMCEAASDAGLDGIGFADHCNVSERERMKELTRALGFTLDLTHERRRAAIAGMADRFDLAVHDAVELDYDRRDDGAIRSFLAEAGFEYAIGSVHYLEGVNVHVEPYFAEKPEAERRRLVEAYFDELVALVDSGLFEVAAHLDLVERNPALRGLATREQYARVAAALSDSRTVPEVNAGRVLEAYGRFHPREEFLDVLVDRGVPFVLGTDAHEPESVAPRVDELERLVDERGLETVELPVIDG